MTNKLTIAVQISKPDLAKQFLQSTKDLKDVEAIHWNGYFAEKGPVAIKAIPDIIIIDDEVSNDNLLLRVQKIKGNFPKQALFVVSENKDPQNIISIMKAGAEEYLVEPVNEKIYHNAVEEVRVNLATKGVISKGQIYSFISAKGGVGSTVLAVNTAVALAFDKNQNVGLFDMSLQSGDASVLLDVSADSTIFDISKNVHRLDASFLRGVVNQTPYGISFLPAPLNPEDSEDIKAEDIRSLLQLAVKLYDQVVLDCTSMYINDRSIEAFNLSEKIFVVTDMSVTSIRNSSRLIKLINKLGIKKDRIELLVNRYIKGGPISISEIEKNFDKPIYWLFPNDFSDIVSSINKGVPIVKQSPGSSFSRNITDFTKKIQGLQKDSKYRGIKGAFGKSI